jgi:gamma-glutamyltranspeptidase/glutathione hydrolase
VLVRQPRLADTLERIGAEGADAFYRGELAEALAAAVRRAGGAMTSDDVRAHATIIAKPVIATFAGAQLALQPPVSQAVLAAMVLRHLDAAPTTDLDRTHAAIEFVEAAFGHRNEIASTDVDALMALTFDYDPRRALRRGGPRGYSHTAAVTTADANGCLVSMLVSIFDDFGSAVLVPEGGYLLNDRLLGFSGTTSNAPSPGARPVHTLSPIIVEQHDRVFALATPGADGQVQLLVQLLDGLIREHAPIAEVLARPRWLSLDGRVVLEAGFPRTLALSLARRGHEVVDESAGPSLFGAACVAGHDVLNGTLYAAMDPRREVWAAAV